MYFIYSEKSNELSWGFAKKQERGASQNMLQTTLMGINTRHTTKTNICYRAVDEEFNCFE